MGTMVQGLVSGEHVLHAFDLFSFFFLLPSGIKMRYSKMQQSFHHREDEKCMLRMVGQEDRKMKRFIRPAPICLTPDSMDLLFLKPLCVGFSVTCSQMHFQLA